MEDRSIGAGPRHARSPALWLFAQLASLGLAGCGGDDGGSGPGSGSAPGGPEGAAGSGAANAGTGAGDPGDPSHPEPDRTDWFGENSISARARLPLTAAGAQLNAQQLVDQLAAYDPGSLLRCDVSLDPDYAAAIDALGGVTWGYSVSMLEDLGKPRFQAGLQKVPPYYAVPGAATGATNAAAPVEIVKPDIVAVTDAAALFYSPVHGLMLVDLQGDEPAFTCATQLPGRVDQFFFHDGHLVAMTKQLNGAGSFLVHLTLTDTTLGFVETVGLGDVTILDSRRFNDKLVFYTDLRLTPAPPPQTNTFPGQGGGAFAPAPFPVVDDGNRHRALRAFTLGDTLQEELHDTLVDTTLSEAELINRGVDPNTAIDTVLSESRRFGTNMWASDHYFAVTEEVRRTLLAGWTSQTYSTCTASHTVDVPYESCETIYEARPNPFYTPPDNSGGDRACKGVTLADCLRDVARVSNETIQVPVRRVCEERIRQDWICDAYTTETVEIPTFGYDHVTRLFIYEYQPDGFVRLDTHVHEVTTPGLDALQLTDEVPTLTTSTETFELCGIL